MNILLVDQFSDPGGAQLCLRDLLPGFLERGWRPRLAIPGTGRLAEEAAEYGVPVHPLPISCYSNGRKTARDVLRFGLDLPQAAATIRRLIRRHRIDVAYVNGPRPLPALVGAGVPVVFHSHSVLDKRYASCLASWALRAAGAGVIAVSRYVAGSWKAISRVQVVYTGVSDQLAAPVRRALTAVRIGIVGRIAPEKGHDDFLAAARLILASGREARFAIHGAALFSDPDYERRIRRAAEGLPVEFRGWVDDIPSMFRELDIVAIPSRSNEAAPRVVLEALSAGVPVVAYRSGGIPELVDHGRSGLLAESPEPASLSAALIALIDDPDLRTRLGKGGREEWASRFTLQRYRREVCDFVESAARGRSNGSGCG